MKTLRGALLTVLLAPGALGHNIHGILLVNGTETPEWKYVLDVANAWTEIQNLPPGSQRAKVDPIIGAANPNVTCGRLAFASAHKTEIADVLAGSEVGFRVSADANGNRDASNTLGPPTFWHPGPALIYLSRAPNDDLYSYQGDGDWFKIAYAGPADDRTWSLYPGISDFNFTIPRTTPPGKYLMRIENTYPTTHIEYLQFYVNCAFVNIIGPGGGTPTEFLRFPGTYQDGGTGFLIPPNQFVTAKMVPDEELRLTEYTPPGPPVWTG